MDATTIILQWFAVSLTHVASSPRYSLKGPAQASLARGDKDMAFLPIYVGSWGLGLALIETFQTVSTGFGKQRP